MAVLGGMINQGSGAAFELWALGIEMELSMHTLVCTATYVTSYIANPKVNRQRHSHHEGSLDAGFELRNEPLCRGADTFVDRRAPGIPWFCGRWCSSGSLSADTRRMS
jgi:hypothetical protein